MPATSEKKDLYQPWKQWYKASNIAPVEIKPVLGKKGGSSGHGTTTLVPRSDINFKDMSRSAITLVYSSESF